MLFMNAIPLDLRKWFGSLPESVAALYSGAFKNSDAALLNKALDDLIVANFTLWGLEDEARRKDLPDKKIADLKRNIDKYNQRRNDLIDRVDAILEKDIESSIGNIDKSLPLNTETPGSVFDRLTVLSLRIHNLKKEISRKDASISHKNRCLGMLKEVEDRVNDLLECLEALLNDYYNRRKRLKSYKQHKLYNDPALNPSLRK